MGPFWTQKNSPKKFKNQKEEEVVRRSICCGVMVLCVVFPALAMAGDVFEDFTSDSGGFSNGYYQLRDDGRYVFDGEDSVAGYYTVWKGAEWASQFTDYLAEVEISFEGGDKRYGYGLIVSALENDVGSDDMIRLLITKGGKYKVIHDLGGKMLSVTDWKNHSGITGNRDVLSVEKIGDEFVFSINGQEIERLTIAGVENGFVGIETSYNVKASYDNFSITDLTTAENDVCSGGECAPVAGTCATFDASSRMVNIPCLSMGQGYSIGLSYDDGEGVFRVSETGPPTAPVDSGCASFDLFSGIMSIPCLRLGADYWVELSLAGSNPLSFALRDYGVAAAGEDKDNDGFTGGDGDCDDGNPAIHPGAEDFCGDGIDQDCDSADAVCDPWITDDDGDGYSDAQGDCDDSNRALYPGAEDVCGDGIDQDCAGGDLPCPPEATDDDGDGYTENQGDCRDNDQTIHPGATDLCGDGIDQDCSGADKACPSYAGEWESIRGAAGHKNALRAFLDITINADHSFNGTYDSYMHLYTLNMPTAWGMTIAVPSYGPVGNSQPVSGRIDIATMTGTANFTGIGTTTFAVEREEGGLSFDFPSGFRYTSAYVEK